MEDIIELFAIMLLIVILFACVYYVYYLYITLNLLKRNTKFIIQILKFKSYCNMILDMLYNHQFLLQIYYLIVNEYLVV